MSEKYTVIQHEKRVFWAHDCPVLLQAHALTKNNVDNSILVQCKFENLSEQNIKAMFVSVKCFDVLNRELTGVDKFSYLDISIQPYTLFGDRTAILLPDNETRNIRITPEQIVFSDNTIWENKYRQAYELAKYDQLPISSLGELASQYSRDLSSINPTQQHHYLPCHENGFVICGCGKIVMNSVANCPCCKVPLKALFDLNNVKNLEKHLSEYNAELEDNYKKIEIQRAKEKAILSEKARQEELQRLQRNPFIKQNPSSDHTKVYNLKKKIELGIFEKVDSKIEKNKNAVLIVLFVLVILLAIVLPLYLG